MDRNGEVCHLKNRIYTIYKPVTTPFRYEIIEVFFMFQELEFYSLSHVPETKFSPKTGVFNPIPVFLNPLKRPGDASPT